MAYSILEANMERLEKKLTRIQNKCKKFGCSFTYEKVGEEFKTLKDDRGVEYQAKFILIEAEGKAVLNDWMFIASVQQVFSILKKETSSIQLDVPLKFLKDIIHQNLFVNTATAEGQEKTHILL